MKAAGWRYLAGLLVGCPGSSGPVSPPHSDTTASDHGAGSSDAPAQADGPLVADLTGAADALVPDLLVPITFGDVPQGHPQYPEIQWVAHQGIMLGCQSAPPAFCPDAPLKRSEVAVTLVRMKHGESFSYTPTPHFGDVPATHWGFKYVQKLFDDGITSGCSAGSFCPENPLLRKNWATFLYRVQTL